VNIRKITVMVDHGYNLEYITREFERIYPQIMTKIKFELAPIPVCWVVERSNAWVERCKSLVENFDRTLDNANARLKLCFSGLCLSTLPELPEIPNGSIVGGKYLPLNHKKSLELIRNYLTALYENCSLWLLEIPN
jgi:hypothetical protein